MKVNVDGKEILDISETKKKVICNEISMDILQEDLERRVCYILLHKYERCFERLKKEWDPKLKAAGVESIPLDEDAYAELVFSQPDYKDKKDRILEVEEK